MAHTDPSDLYDGRAEFVQQLLDYGHLKNAHAGVARQLIAQGQDSLSSKQRMILEEYILDKFKDEICLRCQCEPEWEDMYEVAFGEGFCGPCLHRMSKGD